MPSRKNSIKPYFIIIGATLLLYLWQLHLYPMINPDGVTYLAAAAAYVKGGFKAAVAIDAQAKWPFYSILIAKVYSYSGLSVFTSAQIVDVLFICLNASLFLYLVRLFSQYESASFWAILIWITWHEYVKWWPTIVRDHGFLTCLLLSFCCYYYFTVTRRFFWALAWSIFMILAELFRIEAVIYWLCVPLSVFFLNDVSFKQKVVLWLKLNALIFLAGFGVVFLFINNTLTIDSLRFAYMWKELSAIYSAIYDQFMRRYHIMHESIFYRENHYAGHALLVAYITSYFAYIIAQISFAILLPLFFIRLALRKINTKMLHQTYIAYVSIAALIPLLFFIEHVFLNGRYLLPLGLFLLLLAASIFPYVIAALTGKKKIFFVTLVSALLVLNFIANFFHFGRQSQDYYIFGTWLKEHYPRETIFTNNKVLLFYDSSSTDYQHGGVYEMQWGGIGDVWLRHNDRWCRNNLLVIVAPRGKSDALQQMFAQFQAQNVLGATVNRYVSDNKEVILAAPIHAEKCFTMVRQERNKKTHKNEKALV